MLTLVMLLELKLTLDLSELPGPETPWSLPPSGVTWAQHKHMGLSEDLEAAAWRKYLHGIHTVTLHKKSRVRK